MEEGLEVGEKKRMEDKISTARNLIALGVDMGVVSKVTGIFVEELEKLII